MITKTTLYATTYGEYSDWSVDKLFNTREDAEAALHAGGYIDEFVLWSEPPHKLPWHTVTFSEREGLLRQNHSSKDGDDDDAARWPSIQPEVHEYDSTYSGYNLHVEGANASANMKLFYERMKAHYEQSGRLT